MPNGYHPETPKRVLGHQDEVLAKRQPDQCFCDWKPGVECPNEYTHVYENLANSGYMKCCEPHHEGFGALGPVNVRVWTRAEWEASGREAELDAEIVAARAATREI